MAVLKGLWPQIPNISSYILDDMKLVFWISVDGWNHALSYSGRLSYKITTVSFFTIFWKDVDRYLIKRINTKCIYGEE